MNGAIQMLASVLRRWKAGGHPHLCAFVVLINGQVYRPLRVDWLA